MSDPTPQDTVQATIAAAAARAQLCFAAAADIDAVATLAGDLAAKFDAALAVADTLRSELQAALAQRDALAVQLQADHATHDTQVQQLMARLAEAEAEVVRLQALLDAAGPVDPPPAPTYRLTSSADTVDEGAALTITLHTTGVPAGTLIGYVISGVDAADLAGPLGADAGRLLIGDDGTASLTLVLAADLATEGPEVLRLVLDGVPGELQVVVRDTSTAPAPPPPPDPLPQAPGGRYRYLQPRLFQPAPPDYPSRLPGGKNYGELRHYGPTAVFVDSMTGWTWDRKGGDWVDADGLRYGTKPWATVDIATEGEHSADVTALVRAPGWLAMLAQCGTQQRLLGAVSVNPPRIEVDYEDGSRGILACWIAAPVTTSSTVPSPREQLVAMPAVLEFDKPTGPVRAARLVLDSSGIATAWGGKPVVNLFKLDPPINRDEPTTGLAAAYPLDAGIDQHPGVFGAHRYEDGSSYDDFVSSLDVNIDDERNFDPALYGTGPQNKALLPHKDLGKWINAGPHWKLVGSDYREERFEPFAPGLGAMRIHMAPAVVVDRVTGVPSLQHDGQTTGYDGTGAAGAKLYLPADRFGLQRRMFVRTGIRLARGDGFVEGPAGRRHIYSQGRQDRWNEDAGKCMPMPIHNRTTGGFSGSAGGGAGWQARCSWAHNDAMLGGPDENSWTLGAHMFDFQGQNPPGHNYALDTRDKTQFGQRGGLGSTLYYDEWYDFEAEIELNSVNQPAVLADGTPHLINGVRQFWTADGAWRVWVDGRLAFERTGLVFRSLPVVNPGFRAGYCRPCRELGAEGLMLNWFHGGVTQNVRPRTMFLSGLVWAQERIGPMQRPGLAELRQPAKPIDNWAVAA